MKSWHVEPAGVILPVEAICRTVACAWFEVTVTSSAPFAVAVALFVTEPSFVACTSPAWIV